MASVQDLFAELLPELGQVQALSRDWVCRCCMGPVTPGWDLCPGCSKLSGAGTPAAVMERVVPMSVAPRPGRWYNRLARYKGGYPEYRAHLAAFSWSFLTTHGAQIHSLLGGEHTAIAPVPSKRGKTFASQALRQAISMVRPMGEILLDALTFVPSPDVTDWRRSYYPFCFDPSADEVAGHRVLLLEDTWVTGATALSAAGALIEHGAESVLILPIARVLDLTFWEAGGNPYVAKVQGGTREGFDIGRWPKCVFRAMRPTHSEGRGPPIPTEEAHLFQGMRPTHFGEWGPRPTEGEADAG